MPPELHYDLAQLDAQRIVADKDAIRSHLPQRFEMEQLDAIIHLDPANLLVAGYKDVRADEFWVRGHMPGYPLMPGVLMCEAAAQLCSFYVGHQRLYKGDFIGFGGMDNVRFRGVVRPGDRLILLGKALKINRRLMLFNVQGFVGERMVFHGDILGMPLNRPGDGPS